MCDSPPIRRCQLRSLDRTPEGWRNVRLSCHLAPGDACVATAVTRSIHDTYPGIFRVGYKGVARELFLGNPFVDDLNNLPSCEINDVTCDYPSIHQSNSRPRSFIESMVTHVGARLGIPLAATTNKPFLSLTPQELSTPPQIERPYIVINAGYKDDMPLKNWGTAKYQAVVDDVRKRTGIKFVQVGEDSVGHNHWPINGAINLIGSTNIRQLLHLVRNSVCGIGPITFLQHVCAGFDRPYFCLAGGREPAQWIQYPLQHTFHTVGLLPCCRNACWKSKFKHCEDLVKSDGAEAWGRCMDLVDPSAVASLIVSYLKTAV